MKVLPTERGARLHCAFQRLDGEVTRDGLWLTSTATEAMDRFRVKAVSFGRVGSVERQSGERGATVLLPSGDVSVEGQTVRFARPGLVEEYSVSMDGVRQDFLVLEKPGGVSAGRRSGSDGPVSGAELRVALEVSGARVEQTTSGARLVLESRGRKIAYSRLKVTDARGKELPARMVAGAKSEIGKQKAEIGLAVVVDDSSAVYPVRIDPTFSDANWISLGGIPGANGIVYASAVDGAGNLYIGGSFTQVGGVVANNIAKWNGSTWTALGSGMGGTHPAVYALAVSGSNLYVGGAFTNADGIAATNIAKWDGTAWSALRKGIGGGNGDAYVPPIVYALAVSGSEVYAGGNFTNAGGVSANYIAKWNGSAWSALGSGTGGGNASYPPVVYALAVSGSDVYAGGDFTTAGGIAANYVAKWNGSTWSALGSGMGDALPYTSGGVTALATLGSNVYAGGYFTTAGGNPAITIAKWDGSAWSAVGSGSSGGGGLFDVRRVTALAVSGNDVYAAWSTNVFCAAGGCGGGGAAIAKWDGNTWSTLALLPTSWEPGDTATPAVYALAASGSDLFAGGNFTTVGGTPANYIAQWDGNTWTGVGSGMNSSVTALAVSGTDLYAGGGFTTAGSIAADHIARWDGNAWSALGSGMNSSVSALAVSVGNVYAGGYFTNAGGIAANYIAKWDGSAWSALGPGMDSGVTALAVSGSDLYAGGYFTTAGGIAANYVAKWNGSTWSALGAGVNGWVFALAVSGGNVYVAGQFTAAGGSPATNIAKWDGSAWSALGSGVDYQVNALAVSGSDVYAGGYFDKAGSIPANYVAKWNGSTWSALGSGVDYYVSALAVSGSNVYAGGNLYTAGGGPVNGIAKWDGSTWSALGSGVNGPVSALALSGSTLYVGGAFTTAGGKVSGYAAEVFIGPPFYFVTTNSSLGFSSGQFYFTLVGPPGSNAVIYGTTDLQTWTALATNPLTGGSLNFTDTLAPSYTRRFYRALLQP